MSVSQSDYVSYSVRLWELIRQTLRVSQSDFVNCVSLSGGIFVWKPSFLGKEMKMNVESILSTWKVLWTYDESLTFKNVKSCTFQFPFKNCQALSISQSLNLSLSLRDRDRADTIITLYHHTTPPPTSLYRWLILKCDTSLESSAQALLISTQKK